MITQGKVSKSLLFDFLGKFNLDAYHSRYAPCIFFGCFKGRGDVMKIINHQGLAVICWRGTDILGMTKEDIEALRKDNIKHIAISDYIAKDLDRHGFKYKKFPITATRLKFDPMPLGDAVYTYIDQRRPKFYGMDIIEKLQDKYKIIIGGGYPPEKMPKIYRRCFIGLRLTQHDGLPNTVIEMGLMGRKCVWNGRLPNAINYKTIDDIIAAIEWEKKKVGVIQFDVARRVFDYLNIGNEWLDETIYV